MGMKIPGKTIVAVFLALALTMICAACGGTSAEAPVEATAEAAVPAAEYWACTGLDMGDGK